MIERYIYEILESGFSAIEADTTILEDVFDWLFELDPSEVEKIKTWFAARPPKVYHGFARADYLVPFVSIVLGQEDEAEMVIGDEAGMDTEDDSETYGEDAFSSIWAHKHNLLCYTQHPDETRYLYEIVKAILTQARDALRERDIFQVHFSGMDLAPNPEYAPENLFVRILQFSCQREFIQCDRSSKLYRATQVGGLHLDSSGSKSEVGNVKTGVTPYVDDGE